MPSPFEMVSGPLTVYTAPEATPAPDLANAPVAPWSLLGTNGGRSISEDGLALEFSDTVESQRVLGSTGIVKLFRTEEDMMMSLTLLDVSVETFALAMSGLPIDTVTPTVGAADFVATPVPLVTTSGAGVNALVATITVDATTGDITAVTWAAGGTGYAVGDTITFTQGDVEGTYTLLAGDETAGVLQALAAVTIAGTTVVRSYRETRLLRGFNVLNLAFVAKGFSPYADRRFAQYWAPKAYASFSGSLAYTKGEAAGIELEIMVIEDNSGTPLIDPNTGLEIANPGYGAYQAELA